MIHESLTQSDLVTHFFVATCLDNGFEEIYLKDTDYTGIHAQGQVSRHR